MNFFLKLISLFFLCIFLTGCGAYFSQPLAPTNARIGEFTPKTKTLKTLPLPEEPVVVGVYDFKDQTGQYKQVENGSSFSTAVSQGATTMLIKALEDSRWFTPIERENLNNLLNERNIIRSTRDEYSRNNTNQGVVNIPPLLYAGILLEGGVVSYDSNILTGGLGARYFGVGGSTQYRQDRITVYLRAVSTSNGKVLKTVYVSKTILSQAVDVSLFRYVNFQRLLEIETGFTKNEPVQLAMQDAIEKSVEALIIEGIEEGIWSTKEGETTNKELVENYNKDKELEESTLLYDRSQEKREFKNSIYIAGDLPLLNGDFAKKRLGYGGTFGFTRKITDYFHLNLSGSFLRLETGDTFTKDFISTDLNAYVPILPFDKFTPFIYAGPGFMADLDEQFNMMPNAGPTLKVQVGAGFSYNLSKRIAVKAFAENNFTFNDNIDLQEIGSRDDFYYNFGLGVDYFFSFGGKQKIEDEQNTEDEQIIQEEE